MKNNKTIKYIIFSVVMLIPIIYSFFYLKSYWNPYGNLQDMKVAIVNLDEGLNGENQGNNIVTKLQEKNVVNICNVNKEDAQKGLENEEYYAIITIPEDFTKNLNSAKENDKKVVKIIYAPNQKMNYLAAQIINKVVSATELEIKNGVTSKVVETLAENLESVPESLQKVSDGSAKLLEGTEKLSNGLNTIDSGVSTLNNNYEKFDAGLKSASNGSKELNAGLNKVDGGIENVYEGSQKLNTALSQINSGVEELSSSSGNGIVALSNGIASLNEGAQSVNNGVNQYVSNVNLLGNNVNNYVAGVEATNQNTEAILNALITYSQISTDENVKAIAQNATLLLNNPDYITLKNSGSAIKNGTNTVMAYGSQITAGTTSLANGANELNEKATGLNAIKIGMNTLLNGLNQVQNGSQDLENGVNTLKNGTEALQNGSKELTTGLETLSNNSDIIKTSLEQLNEGTNSAYNGSVELENGVNTLKTEVDNGIETSKSELTKLQGISDYTVKPIEVVEEDYGKVESYGVAFTPLFISIGLWVGALMNYVVLYYDQKHRFGKFDSKYENKIKQNLLYLVCGFVEGIVTAMILQIALKFDVQNVFVYYIVSGLIGVCFTSIIQLLIRSFGDVGKFIALIILVLQLAASGGTFPVDTIWSGFRWLNPILPMTYTIKMIKDCVIATDVNFLAKNSAIIIGITIICSVITFMVEIMKNKLKEEK